MRGRAGIFFVDDNFIGNKHQLKTDLLPALIEWQKNRRGITFLTEVSINLADDDELMRMMADAGFDMVFIGIETPDDGGLAECSKKQNRNRDLLGDIRKIQRAGLQVQGGFIVGFDSDTPGIFQRQIDFIQKSGITTAMVGMLQAIPGTKLHERMKTFLREYKSPKRKYSIRLMHIIAFIKSVYHLGIISNGRYYYWKLLFWTQFRRPGLFPLAITLAIYGCHFRKVSKQNVA